MLEEKASAGTPPAGETPAGKSPGKEAPAGKSPGKEAPAGKSPVGSISFTRYVTVEGRTYPVFLSDDSEALQAACAAGRAIIGIWPPDGEGGEPGGADEDPSPDGNDGAGEARRTGTDGRRDGFSDCLYLVEDPEDADGALLEKAVRRRFGLPFLIGETGRLIIREFCGEDPLEAEDGADPTRVFCDRSLRDAYIDGQYRFHECGLWALVEKKSGRIIGKAGITDGELGYHIYKEFRGQGYALEACRRILSYAARELELKRVFLRTEQDNLPSVRLAEKLGFWPLAGEESGPAAPGELFFDRLLP